MNDIDQTQLDEILAGENEFVLVDFWADWCGPCKVLRPVLESLSPEYADRVTFVGINADENREIMNMFGIRSLPTVLVLKSKSPEPGAKVVAQAIGVKPRHEYVKLLDKATKPKTGLLGKLFGA